MNKLVKIEDIKKTIIPLNGINVIPDFLVAQIYDVQTREINQAVKNNLNKFPDGYIIEFTNEDKKELIKKFDHFNLKHSSAKVKGFTEKGLYMLATILKGPVATQTTIAIVETFAEIRELKRTLLEMHDSDSDEFKKKGMLRIGEILADMIMPEVQTTETKTSLEFNFFIGKLKHEVTRQRINENADIILKEKVLFAKRMLAKGFSMEETIELAGLTEKDLPRLEEIKRNQRYQI